MKFQMVSSLFKGKDYNEASFRLVQIEQPQHT